MAFEQPRDARAHGRMDARTNGRESLGLQRLRRKTKNAINLGHLGQKNPIWKIFGQFFNFDKNSLHQFFRISEPYLYIKF